MNPADENDDASQYSAPGGVVEDAALQARLLDWRGTSRPHALRTKGSDHRPSNLLQAFYAAVQNAGGDVDASDAMSVMESLMAPSAPATPAWSTVDGQGGAGGDATSMYGGSAAGLQYPGSVAESFVIPSAPPSDAGTAALGSSYGQQLAAYTAPPEPAPAFMQPVPNYPESAYSQSMYSYQSGYQVKTVRYVDLD